MSEWKIWFQSFRKSVPNSEEENRKPVWTGCKECVCDPGLHGPRCNSKCDDTNCLHGGCVDRCVHYDDLDKECKWDHICVCDDGWFGQYCSTPSKCIESEVIFFNLYHIKIQPVMSWRDPYLWCYIIFRVVFIFFSYDYIIFNMRIQTRSLQESNSWMHWWIQCKNGATCDAHDWLYNECNCLGTGHHGSKCELSGLISTRLSEFTAFEFRLWKSSNCEVLFESHLKDCDPNPCVNGKCDFNSNKVNDPYCDCGVGFNGTACEITVCDTNKEKFSNCITV